MSAGFVVGEDDNPEDSAFRFVVKGHPELGEHVTWDAAVAAAWTVTPAGAKRQEVLIAPKGVQQFRTSDPDDDEPSEPAGIVIDDDVAPRIHLVREFGTEWVATTTCGLTRSADRWSTYNAAIDGPGYKPCPGCHWIV